MIETTPLEQRRAERRAHIARIRHSAEVSVAAAAPYAKEVISLSYPDLWEEICFLAQGNPDDYITRIVGQSQPYLDYCMVCDVTGEPPIDYEPYLVRILENSVEKARRKRTPANFDPGVASGNCFKCDSPLMSFERFGGVNDSIYCPECRDDRILSCPLCHKAMDFRASAMRAECAICGYQVQFLNPLPPVITTAPSTSQGIDVLCHVETYVKRVNPDAINGLLREYDGKQISIRASPRRLYTRLLESGANENEAQEVVKSCLSYWDRGKGEPNTFPEWARFVSQLWDESRRRN